MVPWSNLPFGSLSFTYFCSHAGNEVFRGGGAVTRNVPGTLYLPSRISSRSMVSPYQSSPATRENTENLLHWLTEALGSPKPKRPHPRRFCSSPRWVPP